MNKVKTEKMDNTNIPTAKEYIRNNMIDYWDGGKAQYTGDDVKKALIEFTKIHVNAAKNEYYQVILREGLITEDGIAYLENAYDLSNIK